MRTSTILCCLIAICFINTAHSQLFKIGLDEKIAKTSLIAEGEVTDQYSFWNAAHSMIYTASTINLSGIFKGTAQPNIEVITQGGTVANYCVRASDLLQLHKGQKGVFFCFPNQLKITSLKTKKLLLDVYSSKQGFLEYGDDNAVYAPFARYDNIAALRNLIAGKVGTAFRKINAASVISSTNTSNSTPGTLAGISGYTPALLNAGALNDPSTNTLTINGSGFGATPSGKCGIKFKDGDNDNTTPTFKIDYTSSYFIKWSDNQIVVQVPDEAATGAFGVVLSDGSLVTSPVDLQVFYAVLNASFNLGSTINKEPRMVNTDGKGGYTIKYSTNTGSSGTDITQSDSYGTFRRALNTWKELVGANINEGGGTTRQNINAYDDVNIVELDNDSTGVSRLSAGVLATTYSGFSICPDAVAQNLDAEKVGFDVLIRNTGVSSGTVDFTTGPCPPAQSQYDLEMTILHELGHAIDLAHINDDYESTNNSYANTNPSKLMHYSILDYVDRRSPDASAYQGALYAVKQQGNKYGNCGGIFPSEMTTTPSLTASNDECPSSFPSTAVSDGTSVFFDLTHSTSNKYGDPSFTQINCQNNGTSVTNNAYYAFTTGSSSTIKLTIKDYTTTPADLLNCATEACRIALYDASSCPEGQNYPSPAACLSFTGNGTIELNNLQTSHKYLMYVDGFRNTKASFNMIFNDNGTTTGPEAKVYLDANPFVYYNVNLYLKNVTPGNYQYAVIDVLGRIMRTGDFTISLPSQTIPVGTGNLPRAVYFLVIKDQTGKTVNQLKFIKN